MSPRAIGETIRVDDYAFTRSDASSTLAAGWALFDQLELHQPEPLVQAIVANRSRAEEILEQALAGTLSEDEALPLFWAEWRGAMAALRRGGAYVPSCEGAVAGLFTSHGGVPKHAQPTIKVIFGGIEGDKQNDRGNHGRPWQAVCLWSTEVIDAFAAAGHPLAPGLAGENITTTGIAWERMVPGARLQVGDVVLEISSYSVPCRKNAPWFTDGHFGLMHHRHGPVSRVYATVLRPGIVAMGDRAVLEPPS